MLIAERLNQIQDISVSKGNHRDIEHGACVMEAVAYVAGEPWSDHPTCACPVLTAFLIAWNDALSDADRDTLLRPLVPLLVGTRAGAQVERRRAMMATDWLVREHASAWLRLAGLTAQADALSGLPEITDMAQCPSIMPALEAARNDARTAGAAAGDAVGNDAMDDAGDAAWAAARAAAEAASWAAVGAAAGDAVGNDAMDDAGDAAWAAARAAAEAASWVAARAAAEAASWAAVGDAVGAAAWAAARAAAEAASWAAVGDAVGAAAWAAAMNDAWAALTPTRVELQQSALRLVHRMIAAGEVA